MAKKLMTKQNGCSYEQANAVLAACVLAGDREAFDILFQRYVPSVQWLWSTLLGRTMEAQDIAQEAALSAFRGLAHPTGCATRLLKNSPRIRWAKTRENRTSRSLVVAEPVEEGAKEAKREPRNRPAVGARALRASPSAQDSRQCACCSLSSVIPLRIVWAHGLRYLLPTPSNNSAGATRP